MLSILWPSPAAMVKTAETKTLLIADLHIGWEMELQKKGIHVPSQTPKLLSKLTAILGKYKPQRLVILGDVKYTVVSSELGEWHDVPDFFMQAAQLHRRRSRCPRQPRRQHRAPAARKRRHPTRHRHRNRRRRRLPRAQVAHPRHFGLQNLGYGASASRRGFP